MILQVRLKRAECEWTTVPQRRLKNCAFWKPQKTLQRLSKKHCFDCFLVWLFGRNKDTTRERCVAKEIPFQPLLYILKLVHDANVHLRRSQLIWGWKKVVPKNEIVVKKTKRLFLKESRFFSENAIRWSNFFFYDCNLDFSASMLSGAWEGIAGKK